jgi:hypothetical protein
MTVGDQAWLESAKRRMIAGEAPHLEMFFLNHRFGRPKDVAETVQKPPILFVSAYGPPGSYDPLARTAEPPDKGNVTGHQRSLTSGVPPDVPHGTTGANGHGDPGPGDDDEEELVVVPG